MKMKGTLKEVYPVVLKEETQRYSVYVPDYDIYTQGNDLLDAIEMARDAISLTGVDYLEDGKDIPKPCSKEFKAEENQILTYVDVDYEEYKRKLDNKLVKKNCTIPYRLNELAIKQGVNFSKVLKEALEKELQIK